MCIFVAKNRFALRDECPDQISQTCAEDYPDSNSPQWREAPWTRRIKKSRPKIPMKLDPFPVARSRRTMAPASLVPHTRVTGRLRNTMPHQPCHSPDRFFI